MMLRDVPTARASGQIVDSHAVPDGPAAGLISVIVPAYNAEATLGAQLTALSKQSYGGPWELILADNGSTDATLDVLSRHRGTLPAVSVVDASSQRGPAHARNRGAAAAKGALLLFCDADDVVSPSWMQAMADASVVADLICGVGVMTNRPETDTPSVAMPDLQRFPFLPWGKAANLGVMRRQFLAVGGFDENRLTGEDVDLCWRVQLAGGRLRFTDGARVNYRGRPSVRAQVARTFFFGRAAHALYRDYSAAGAPEPGLRWALRGGLRLVYQSPTVLFSRQRRISWIARLGGISGRLSAVAQHILSRPRRHERTSGGPID